MGKGSESVLVVDDERDIRDLLSYTLEKEGFEVRTAANGDEAIAEAHSMSPDYILLDIMMPKKDGIEVCRALRNDTSFDKTFILILTARGEEYSEVAGFDAGADDYVVKPIKIRSLISRLRALKKRPKTNGAQVLEFTDLTVDPQQYNLQVRGETVQLPKKEFELLYLLARNANKVVSRDQILDEIWGRGVVVGERTIDVHVRRIREKIGDDRISTVKGVGYKFTG